MNTLKTFFVLASLLLLFLSPNSVSAQSAATCAQFAGPDLCNAQNELGCHWEMYTCEYSPLYVNQDKISDSFDAFDPMNNKFERTSDILNSLLPYLLTGAGLILFGMLIWGGFTMLTATTDPKKAEAGKQRITSAIVGFIIIFTAYWLTQILEIILGVKIL